MKKKVAFFDFDGTITTKDTLLEFIKFSKGNAAFYFGFLKHLPSLVLFKLGLVNNQLAKENILRHFFNGTPLSKFQNDCNRFSDEVIPRLIRPGAAEEIRQLQDAGVTVVIVSASPENWLQAWADSLNAQLIASRLQVVDSKLTGKILGKNCHGDEKVERIRSHFNLSDYDVVAAYGDSKGDLPMLRLATAQHYKPFRS